MSIRKTLFRTGILLLLLTAAGLLSSCSRETDRIRVTLWHQMSVSERDVLAQAIEQFNANQSRIEVVALFRETEELRSGYQAAALAGTGPDLIYGPSDQIGPFSTMGIIRALNPYFSELELREFLDKALTSIGDSLYQIGDRIGNHLTLVYNRELMPVPPRDTDELISMGKELTRDLDGDGRIDQYGLVWNYTEPYFFVPFLTGFGGRLLDEQNRPDLNKPATIKAFQFVSALRDSHKITPIECDYNVADALFKEGRAAMLINGDWSWQSYLEAGIDMAIAPIPRVTLTGKWPAPLVSPRGYSLNVNSDSVHTSAALLFMKYMLSRDIQEAFATQVKVLPSHKQLQADPELMSDPILRNSALQMSYGTPMPVVSELRAVWDAMRPVYQAVLGGYLPPRPAARMIQQDALSKIEEMNLDIEGGSFAIGFRLTLLLLAVFGGLWQRRNIALFLQTLKKNRLAYYMILPAAVVILLTILYPFVYNLVLSFSNMSLHNFRNWEIVGFQNYLKVFSEPIFYTVFGKTILWTVLNLLFHVSLGVMLAVVLHRYLPGKGIYRMLLILPWAIPQYITALTWRGMFNAEYGAINLVLTKYLSLPMINWLHQPAEAFSACVVTNVWLGFPFMMVIALGGLQSIPLSLYEAASVDGASRLRQFFTITLPLLKPVMMPAIVLGTIWTFNNLNVMWLVSNGGEPGDHTHILVSYVYKAAFNLYRYGYAAALSVLIFLILLALGVTMLRRSRATASVYH